MEDNLDMGWERRGKAGRMVYYRVTRSAEGKVVKQYFGRGERAAAAAAVVARSKAQRNADRQAVQEEQALLAGPEGVMVELIQVAHLLMEGTLLASGFHRLNYGKWRKRRVKDGNPTGT
jgi:hypothetical protein